MLLLSLWIGIGFLILQASSQFRIPLMFAGVAVIAFTGVLTYVVFALIERRVTGWATRRNTVMVQAGVAERYLRVLGFPVLPRFVHDRPQRPAGPPPRILYMVNAGKETAPAIVERLLQIDPLHLTVTVGRDEELRARIEAISAQTGRPVEIHGWTQQMPELLMTHHVLIGKAKTCGAFAERANESAA